MPVSRISKSDKMTLIHQLFSLEANYSVTLRCLDSHDAHTGCDTGWWYIYILVVRPLL